MNNNALGNNNQQVQATTSQTPLAPAKEQSNQAKDAIKAHLDARAASDSLFAVSYSKPNKSIDECFRYILGEARKRGNSVCMTDDEVFGLAIHYYDEDNIEIASIPANYNVSTSRKPAQSAKCPEEDSKGARQATPKRYEKSRLEDECKRAKSRKDKGDKPFPMPLPDNLPSLFGLDEI